MHAVEEEEPAERQGEPTEEEAPPPRKKLTRQAWRVPVTPRERFEIISMMGTREQLVKGQEEIARFKRFKSALGIDAVVEIAVNGDGRVSPILAASTRPSLFVLTLENAEFFLKIFIERLGMSPRQQVILEPLTATLTDLVAGGDDPKTKGLEEFDPASEDWKP